MKKRDRRLQKDNQLFNDTWQIVKESVRQLKHDHKRNMIWRSLRIAQNVDNNLAQSQDSNVNAPSHVVIRNDESNI